MYSIKRVDGQYLAINTKNMDDKYIVPEDIARALMRNNKMQMEDLFFNNLKQTEVGIIPFNNNKTNHFDELNKEQLVESKTFLNDNENNMDKIRKKSKKVNRVKARKIKKIKIRIAAGVMAVIMAWSGIGALKKKLHKEPTSDYTTEKTIDTTDSYINENKDNNDSNYVNEDLTDDSSNNDNSLIEEESNDLDTQEESTEYYYNLDGEVDRQNWENVMKYEKEFKEAEKIFGIDHKLLMAIACQESSGIHNPDDGEYATGIMRIEPVHKGEIAPFYNHVTKKQDSIKIDKDNLNNVKTNIFIGAALFQHNCDLACEKGFDNKILKSSEVIPAALFGYNNGPTAQVKALNAYKESGEESYNSFIRSTISANIGDEDLIWHLKYPALVFNKRNKENQEFWVKDANGKIYATKPINESKMYSSSFSR